jgi:DNA-binding response OmpR family regulator
MRILVIEDDSEVRDMVCKMLSDKSFDVVAAINGREGMELISKASNIDLVITDLIMPEKEGLETIRELKRDFSPIKILAISGGGKGKAQDYLTAATIMGADSTLGKPFVKQELIEAVQELLQHE